MRLGPLLIGAFVTLSLIIAVLGWYAIDFSLTAQALLQTSADATTILIGLWGLSLLVILTVGVFLYVAVIRPVVVLSRAVLLVGEGNLNMRIHTEGDTEVAELGRAFNTMVERLAANIAERERAEQTVRRLNEELERKVAERTQDLLETRDELVRKEKLAVLGQVAGSVGHELRNPLGVMSNAVYFLQTVLSDADETTREYLNIIKDEIAISDRIVSDLLDSVRSKPPHPEVVGVREVIERTVHQLTIPDSVSVSLDIPEALPALRVDAMQIKQVFSNLISNGVEAMPGGGVLEIRAVENRPDGTVTVSVRDSGSGMTQEHLTKLFEPLFTTKSRGIGLGLVVVKNLTEANGGKVNVESEVGKGSTFTVALPCGGAAVDTV